MQTSITRSAVAIVAAFGLALAACGTDDGDDGEAAEAPSTVGDEGLADDADAAAGDEPAPADQARDGDDEAPPAVPTIVVTTNILGDVADEVFGGSAEVVTIMPVGADPHDFRASAQEVDQIMSADALIVNGGDLEEGLLDVIESAEMAGVPTFEALGAVDTIEFSEGGHDHDDHGDEDHDHAGDAHIDDQDEDHSHDADENHSHTDDDHTDDEPAHDRSGADPHFWLDPIRMAAVVDGMVAFVRGEIEFADAAALEASAAAYVAELEAVDAGSVTLFETIPEGGKVLVTNHDSLGYFAAHYGFEIAGTVIPSSSTQDAADAGELAELAEVIEQEQVSAIFADNSASDELAQVLADEVGGIEVVELYTGSLGEPGSEGETYLMMLRTNAERISSALG